MGLSGSRLPGALLQLRSRMRDRDRRIQERAASD